MLVVWVNTNEEEPGTWKEGKMLVELEFQAVELLAHHVSGVGQCK